MSDVRRLTQLMCNILVVKSERPVVKIAFSSCSDGTEKKKWEKDPDTVAPLIHPQFQMEVFCDSPGTQRSLMSAK